MAPARTLLVGQMGPKAGATNGRESVTHVPGLKCYPCPRLFNQASPAGGITADSSQGELGQQSNLPCLR